MTKGKKEVSQNEETEKRLKKPRNTDINFIKGRVAEAIFRQIVENSGYVTIPLGIEVVAREATRLKHDTYLEISKVSRSSPDFLIIGQSNVNRKPITNQCLIDVKFRQDEEKLRSLKNDMEKQARLYGSVMLVLFCPKPKESSLKREKDNIDPYSYVRCALVRIVDNEVKWFNSTFEKGSKSNTEIVFSFSSMYTLQKTFTKIKKNQNHIISRSLKLLNACAEM